MPTGQVGRLNVVLMPQGSLNEVGEDHKESNTAWESGVALGGSKAETVSSDGQQNFQNLRRICVLGMMIQEQREE